MSNDQDSGVPPSERTPLAPDPLHHAATIEYRAEVIRKGIHLVSLSIPVIYAFITKERALWLLIPVTSAFLIADIARHLFPSLGRLFLTLFGPLLRRHEQDGDRKRLNGATYVLLSAVFCVAVFPKLITITAFAILIISDTTSALVGRKFGRRRFFRKSLEGAMAFFVSAVLVVLVAPKAGVHSGEFAIGFVGAAVGTVVESASTIDDNFAIPASIGLVMWLLYAVFFPGADLGVPPAVLY